MREISKKQRCVMMRNGVELWLEETLAQKFENILENARESKFILFQNRVINTADCTGIYLPEDMEALTRRKNGQWQCQYGIWHEKRELCHCISQEEKERRRQYQEQFHKERGYYPPD